MKGKQLLALLLVLCMAVVLFACKPDDNGGDTTTDPTTSQTGDTTNDVPDATDPQSGETTTGGEDDPTTTLAPSATDTTAPGGKTDTTTTTPVKPSTPAAETDPLKMDKAALIAYYNKAANDAKTNAKSIVKTENRTSQAGDPWVSSSMLNSLASWILPMFLSDNWKAANTTYTTAAEKKDGFPVQGQSYASKLTAADVSSATAKASGKNTVVTIKVKGASVNKAFSIVTGDIIKDAAGSYIDFKEAKITYSTSTITATIAANGKLQKIEYFMPDVTMYFKVSLAGEKEASLPVTMGDRYTINW